MKMIKNNFSIVFCACIILYYTNLDAIFSSNISEAFKPIPDYATIAIKSMELWTTLDLIKAVKTTEVERRQFIEQVIDDLVNRYAEICGFKSQNQTFFCDKVENIIYLSEIYKFISIAIDEIFQEALQSSVICAKVLARKILTELSSLKTESSVKSDLSPKHVGMKYVFSL